MALLPSPMQRCLAIANNDGNGAKGDKVNDDGNSATGNDVNNDGEGTTYNNINDH